MSELKKITEAEMDEKGVCAAPDILSGSPEENKAIFDRMVRQVVAPAYNAAVDAVNEMNATESGIIIAESGRVSAEARRAAAEEERVSTEQERDTAEQARMIAETARATAETMREEKETGYIAQAGNNATLAQSWAVGMTGSRVGEDGDNAKFYAEQAALIVGGDYANKVKGGTEGNLAALTANGDIADSGKPVANTTISYYKSFIASDWSGGKLVLPGNTHSIRSTAVFCQVSVLSTGVQVQGTWAAQETYATIDGTGNITLHYDGTAYAGAVLVVG